VGLADGARQDDPASHRIIHHAPLRGERPAWLEGPRSFPNIPPTETMQLCDLIKNPDQHTQYQPK
jgi:hypothetical protein